MVDGHFSRKDLLEVYLDVPWLATYLGVSAKKGCRPKKREPASLTLTCLEPLHKSVSRKNGGSTIHASSNHLADAIPEANPPPNRGVLSFC